MTEKQNAEMLELERRILAGVIDRQPRDHIRKIFAALRAAAPPPAGEERELTSEQISIINDMTHAWVEERNLVEFRMSFRQDCKRLLATVALPPAGADAVREIACHTCGGSGFSGHGTGYDDVCSECGGQRYFPAPSQSQEKPE